MGEQDPAQEWANMDHRIQELERERDFLSDQLSCRPGEYGPSSLQLYRKIQELERENAELKKAAQEALALLDRGKPGWGVSRDILRRVLANES